MSKQGRWRGSSSARGPWMCGSERLIRGSRAADLRQTLRRAMTHSRRVFLLLGATPKRTSTQRPQQTDRSRQRRGARAWFLPLAAGAYLPWTDANSDPLLRTLLLLLLGQFVSSSEASHLSHSPGAEEKQAQRWAQPPGAQVRGRPKPFLTVGAGEDDAPCREPPGCGSSSSWGGGLTLPMRLCKLGLFNVC